MNDSSPRGGAVARAGAGLLGLAALLSAGLFTLGTAIAAPLGVLLVWWLAKRSGRSLSRPVSWMGAVGASTLAIALGFAFIFAKLPEGEMDRVIAEAQSAEAPPPPAWVEKIAPGYSQRNAKMARSTPITVTSMIIGVVFATTMFGTLAGSAGWGATLLLGYAGTGRWIGRRPG